MTSPSGWTEPETEPGPEPTPEPERVEDDRLLRAMADLDNLRKRTQREVARARDDERSLVVNQWLPVIDDLDRALEHATADAREHDGLTEGLRVVRDHALAVLARLGYPRFGAIGEPFDPARHEAVSAVEADAPPGTVVAVVRPGYGTPEGVLRPAGVVVARS
jgi:molecular chaperone GrpE